MRTHFTKLDRTIKNSLQVPTLFKKKKTDSEYAQLQSIIYKYDYILSPKITIARRFKRTSYQKLIKKPTKEKIYIITQVAHDTFRITKILHNYVI